MTRQLSTRNSNGVAKNARPLTKLVPLIKTEIKLGFQAGQRHWLALGRLLNEARSHFPASGPNTKGLTFHQWVGENFAHPMSGEPLAQSTVRGWMLSARKVGSAAVRRNPKVTSVTNNRTKPSSPTYEPKLDWQAGIRKVQQTINVDQLAKDWNDEEREERELRKLAKKIITAGYRALSAVVHPDKPGGSTEAMRRLTDAKKWLEEAISE